MKTKLLSIVSVLLIIAVALAIFVSCDNKPKEIPADELSLLENDIVERADSDVRIMSANVLVHIKSWGGEPVISRADRFARAVKHYQPDVIGAQEFCSDWYSKFLPMVKDAGYKVIKEKYKGFTENRSPIIYNANVLDVVDHGIQLYSKGDDNGCRVVSWAVFKRKSDEKIFAVTSTHLDLIRPGKEEAQLNIMLDQVDEFFDVISKIKTEYKCPVYMCGDYNCMEEREEYLETEYYGAVSKESAAYTVYNKIAGKYTDAKYANNINKYDVGGGILPEGAWSSPTWDHIFMTGNTEVKSFAILSSLYFQRYEDRNSRISDHLPIFADFKIN